MEKQKRKDKTMIYDPNFLSGVTTSKRSEPSATETKMRCVSALRVRRPTRVCIDYTDSSGNVEDRWMWRIWANDGSESWSHHVAIHPETGEVA